MRPESRIEGIDALRGAALIGILQVNIQSYAWGAGDPLGYLERPAAIGESLLYFLQAAFLEGKFYPIFAFLFGVSMALQLRRLRHAAGGIEGAIAAYRRRLFFLLGIGIAHALLLFCGDVLAAYALCGLLFIAFVPRRPRTLGVVIGASLVVAALSLFVPIGLSLLIPDLGPLDEIPDEALIAHLSYASVDPAMVLRQRAYDAIWLQLGAILDFWPQVLAMFAVGFLAALRGWLHRPQRHARLWRGALRLGLWVGLPCALLGGALTTMQARIAPGADAGWDDVILGASSLLSCAYVALFLNGVARPGAQTIRSLLACAGRLSLTHYLTQSVAMCLLLSGWGLNLAQDANRGELALIGLAISAAQLALSPWILARFRQGPAEALLRRWTYRGLPPSG